MSSRRNFLKQAAAVAATAVTGSTATSFAMPKSSVLGANERINLAIVGVNARGLAHSINFAKSKGCKVGLICDCDTQAMARAQDEVNKITGNRPQGEQDIRRMLENKDIDAVVIATPDHWHAPAAIMAMQADKHVYLEKPTSHNISENDLLVRAAAKYRKVVQVGNQRRSWPNLIEGIKLLHDGKIGTVRFGKGWYINHRASIGKGKVVPVPAHIDWDLWQGPAPRTEFHDNYLHYNWHWFWHWGTGEALNNGMHYVDILRWGLKEDYPVMVSSVGGRYHFTDDDWETPDTQLISFQFADGASFYWEGRSCNALKMDGQSSGMTFYGDNGSLHFTGGNQYTLYDEAGKEILTKTNGEKFDTANTISPSEALDQYHYQNWFDGIRLGDKLHSDICEACLSTHLVQLGNIAQRIGHSLQIDPLTGRIIGDLEAQKFYSREYEPGWEIHV